jgi:hypothetical protein
MGRCPNHDDRQPSLSIREGRRGVILVYCFAGCRTRDVIEAAGVKWNDLFEHDHQFFWWRLNHVQERPKQKRYVLLRDQWQETLAYYRWLDWHIEHGKLELIPLYADHERALDEISRELHQLEREGYHHAR